MANDIFISYRRDGAEILAMFLHTRLTEDGYSVFLDMESLRSGKFNEQIYDQIAQCKDFISVLPPNGLDRCCSDPGDWVRLETAKAIQLGKNIIPIMMRGFDFPEDLPKDIEELRLYKGLTASTEYFDAMYDRLKSMLLSKSHRPVSAASEQKMYSMRLTVWSPVETTVSINDEESIVMIIDPNSGFDYQSQDIQVPSGFDLIFRSKGFLKRKHIQVSENLREIQFHLDSILTKTEIRSSYNRDKALQTIASEPTGYAFRQLEEVGLEEDIPLLMDVLQNFDLDGDHKTQYLIARCIVALGEISKRTGNQSASDLIFQVYIRISPENLKSYGYMITPYLPT